MSLFELWLTSTASLVSRSVKLSAPLSVSVAAPLPSVLAPAVSPIVSVGWSLLPVTVTVISCWTVPPWPSLIVTVNFSVAIWPAARYCVALLATL